MKATADTLIQEIAPDFTQYLKLGNLNSFTQKIDPNLDINDVEKLLRIHFVLTESGGHYETGVIDFIKALPHRIRRIRTTVSHTKETYRGRVRGRIDWKSTLSARYSQNPADNTLFVCSQREKNYNIDENLVLKELLRIIHTIVNTDLAFAINNKYDWIKGWVKEDQLYTALRTIFHKSIYLRRIDLSDVHITERMITRAQQSRQPLYRQAAELLLRYKRIMNYDLNPQEAEELLNNTFIQPEKTEVLFELYWAITILKQVREQGDAHTIQFNIIKPTKNLIAQWEQKGYTYKLYHDSTGALTFHENISSLPTDIHNQDNYIGRHIKTLQKLKDMVENVHNDTLWGGRPDILIEKYDHSHNLKSIFIGEVKYTDNTQYATRGLKELLEYIALIKTNDTTYWNDFNTLFDNLEHINGCLFIDQAKDIDIKPHNNIKIIRFGDTHEHIVPEEF